MAAFAQGEVTQLLQAWRSGEQAALHRLVPVNEAYLRLAGISDISCPDRVHFPALCAQLMRLDDALTALARIDPRKAEAVELRFFGGLKSENQQGRRQ